jgi:predicted house-cleaning noncanonical NTP pyrophosphatase (MazG superfamily)
MTAFKPTWGGGDKPSPVKVKLVRDHIERAFTRQLNEGDTLAPCNTLAGKRMLLQQKLHEESAEIADNPGDPAEYADLLEVMLELAKTNGVPWAEIEKAVLEKREERGGFRRGMVLTRNL